MTRFPRGAVGGGFALHQEMGRNPEDAGNLDFRQTPAFVPAHHPGPDESKVLFERLRQRIGGFLRVVQRLRQQSIGPWSDRSACGATYQRGNQRRKQRSQKRAAVHTFQFMRSAF